MEQRSKEVDGWPLPTPDVLRELEPPPLVWSGQEPAIGPEPRSSARG